MTSTQAQILDLFVTLPDREKRELAEQLYVQTHHGLFHDQMSPDQQAQLAEGVAQADRGEVVPSQDAFDRIARKLNLVRA